MNNGAKILLVDDEASIRDGWRRYLAAEGCTVTTAEDGEQAILTLAREPVDLVIADQRMPGKSGLEVLSWIRDHQPDTRFILFTGYGSHELEEHARNMGAHGYLEKPVPPQTLVLAAASVLEAKSAPALELPSPPVLNELPAPATPPASPPATAPAAGVRSLAKDAGLLAVAPVLGLVYVMALPLIGFAAAGWYLGRKAVRALRRKK